MIRLCLILGSSALATACASSVEAATTETATLYETTRDEPTDPRAQASVHMLDTVHRRWGSYAMAATRSANVLVDGDYFAAGDSTTVLRTDLDTDASGDPWPGHVRVRSSRSYNGANVVESNPGAVDRSLFDDPFEEWPTTDENFASIKVGSGRRDVPTWPGSAG